MIESGAAADGPAATIKLHHNVGGLPEDLGFELIEPLRDLFKDEVRRLGLQLGLPEDIVWRHPFPGPGLAVRCLGEVTKQRLDTLREADAIVVDEIKAAGLYRADRRRSFAVLLPVQSVGVMGDARTYDDVVAVRSVDTEDFMTADWSHLPYDLLARISTRIINEVKGVNRVVYDISSQAAGDDRVGVRGQRRSRRAGFRSADLILFGRELTASASARRITHERSSRPRARRARGIRPAC